MKNKAYRLLFMVMALGFILPQFSLAQSDKKLIREGNKDYNFIDFLFIGNISFNEDLNINVIAKA